MPAETTGTSSAEPYPLRMSIQLEDGILSDMLVADHYAGGPARAIDEFLRASDGRYAIDRRYCDYFGRNVTWNVHSYLRRQR